MKKCYLFIIFKYIYGKWLASQLFSYPPRSFVRHRHNKDITNLHLAESPIWDRYQLSDTLKVADISFLQDAKRT